MLRTDKVTFHFQFLSQNVIFFFWFNLSPSWTQNSNKVTLVFKTLSKKIWPSLFFQFFFFQEGSPVFDWNGRPLLMSEKPFLLFFVMWISEVIISWPWLHCGHSPAAKSSLNQTHLSLHGWILSWLWSKFNRINGESLNNFKSWNQQYFVFKSEL